MAASTETSLRFDQAHVASLLTKRHGHVSESQIREIADQTRRYVERHRLQERIDEFITRSYTETATAQDPPYPQQVPRIKATRVDIWSTALCPSNPGPGSYAAIITEADRRLARIAGHEDHTTPNRMELTSALSALHYLSDNTSAVVYTDSRYLCNAFNLGWVSDWKRRGWKRAKGNLKNADLWQALARIVQSNPERPVTFALIESSEGYPRMTQAKQAALQELPCPTGDADTA